MIIKEADDKSAQVALLEALLAEATPEKRPRIKRELFAVAAGIKGEKEAAYLLDFRLRDSSATAVVHDLRLEIDGLVAQIDHLLVHRTYRFYVLETKHFRHGLKITEDGEFLRWDDFDKRFSGMPSPIEQNERHVAVLRKTLAGLGMAEPAIKSFILVAPEARIDRPKKFDTSMVVKADQFVKKYEEDLGKTSLLGAVGGLVRTTVSDSVAVIADKLFALHQPISIDYRAKFGMPDAVLAGRAGPIAEKITEDIAGHCGDVYHRSPEDASYRAPVSSGMKTEIACRTCGGHQVAVQHGKYGYYLKCGACNGNTPIKLECSAGHKEKIRKDGQEFFRECSECASSNLYFVNLL